MIKNISVAHSPDADDIFMYAAVGFGWVDSEWLRFSSIAADIETLNINALKSEFDATAISFGVYPKIWEDYALLRTAVSFGEGYGPKLVKRKDKTLKPNFKVALSGQNTTNALLFKMAYPNARIVYKNFLDIESSVISGEVDAGVLIHESILEVATELCVEREIWDIWCELNGENLPLPLGGMAIRRSLPLTDAIEVERVLTKAVKVATENKKILSQMLIDRGLVRVDDEKLKIYLDLYANMSSIEMSEVQLNAVDRLFELGFEKGVFGRLIRVRDSLVPTEYLKARNSEE